MTAIEPIETAFLIDDDEVHTMLYARVMKKSGLIRNIKTFEMAEDALDFLDSHTKDKVDIIFLDINMPRMDGFEFLDSATDQLGANFAEAVIIMLTTSLNPDDRQRARQYDVVKDFINKPLTIEHVQHAVQLVKREAGQ